MLRKWLVAGSSSKTPDHLPSPKKAKNKEDGDIIISGNAGVSDSEKTPTSNTSTKKRKRGNYNAYDSEQRAKMARHAVEYGVMNASRKYNVNESTIRSLKKQFQQNQIKDGTAPTQLEKKDRGKPLLLGSSLDTYIQTYVKYQRQAGNPISVQILLGASRGIVLSKKRQLLIENGGPVDLTKSWAQSLLRRMGYVNRKGTKAARKVPSDFDLQKMEFLAEIQRMVSKFSIPDDLVINFDQTGVNIVPVGNYTLEACGSKQVPIIIKLSKINFLKGFCANKQW